MLYLPDPAPVQTAQPYDDSALKAAVDTLRANETIDDQTASALETLVKAKDAAHDQALADLKARIDAIPTQTASVSKAEIEALYDLLPIPTPIQVLSGSGATATPATTGSLLVNQGKTHTTARTTTPPLIAWESTMTISPVVGECRVRWAILTVRQGTLEIQLGTASAIQASNTGLGWDCADPTVTIKIDGNYTCFDKLIPAQQSPLTVRFQFPTGPSVVQLPSLYSPATPFSMLPDQPTGLKLRAMPGGETLEYRPLSFAKPSDIPKPFDSAPLSTRIDDLEYGLNFVSNAVVAFSSEANISSQLASVHPNGGLYKEFVTQNEGRAIDLTLGSNVTAATLKTELEAPATDTVIRIKAGQADAIIANTSLIPAGLYRLWRAGGQIRIRVLDSY